MWYWIHLFTFVNINFMNICIAISFIDLLERIMITVKSFSGINSSYVSVLFLKDEIVLSEYTQ